VAAAAVAAGYGDLYGGELLFTPARMARFEVPIFAPQTATSVSSVPKEYLSYLDARADSALVKLLHHGVLVKTRPRLRCGHKYLSRLGISAIAATRSP
jgi:hypothetical protein